MRPHDYGCWTKYRIWDKENGKFAGEKWYPGWVEPTKECYHFYLDGKIVDRKVAMVDDMWGLLAGLQEIM